MQAGLAEIQKNIAMLTSLKEPLQIVDKRRKRIIATVYPKLQTNNAAKLAGKYRNRIAANRRNVTFNEAREQAMVADMKAKYGNTD